MNTPQDHVFRPTNQVGGIGTDAVRLTHNQWVNLGHQLSRRGVPHLELAKAGDVVLVAGALKELLAGKPAPEAEPLPEGVFWMGPRQADPLSRETETVFRQLLTLLRGPAKDCGYTVIRKLPDL